MKSSVFRMPNAVTINGRSSSLTNAFVNGIIPCLEPSKEEILDALSALGQTEDDVTCVYCGEKSTEWDHLNPLVIDQKPTGYISEIRNLVPSCGKCNQSKGNKHWKKWIRSKAKLSPYTRNVIDLENRIKTIDKYERQFKPLIVQFEEIVGPELWKKHWENHRELLEKLKEMQTTSNELRDRIRNAVNRR